MDIKSFTKKGITKESNLNFEEKIDTGVFCNYG